MIGIIESAFVVCYDVDNTLVTKDPDVEDLYMRDVKTPWENTETVYVIDSTVQQLKKDSVSGRFVVVWSQQGHEWARAIVNALDLDKYVGLIMAKPQRYYDDLLADSWMNRIHPSEIKR